MEYTVDSVLDQSQPLVVISKGKAQEILGNVHSSVEGSCTLEMTQMEGWIVVLYEPQMRPPPETAERTV